MALEKFVGRGGRIVQHLALTVSLVALWQVVSGLGYLTPIILPPPAQVAGAFRELVGSGAMARHLGASVLRVLEGFAIAALAGLSLGTAIGLSRTTDRLTNLLIQLLKPIPPIAWIPLAILWFGIGESSKVYIIFVGAFFPIIINTTDGIRQTDSKFVELARILEVSRSRFVWQVVIPGAFPSIMTGLRVGLMVAWMCVVAAEMIAAGSGIGYLIMDARQLSQSDVVLVGMATIGLVGKVMDSVLKRIERRLIGWKAIFAGE